MSDIRARASSGGRCPLSGVNESERDPEEEHALKSTEMRRNTGKR